MQTDQKKTHEFETDLINLSRRATSCG